MTYFLNKFLNKFHKFTIKLIIKSIIIFLSIYHFATFSLLAQNNINNDENNIIALVNKKPITKSDIEDRVKILSILSNIDTDNHIAMANIKKNALSGLIDDIILDEFATLSKVNISKKDIDSHISKIEKYSKMPNGYFKQQIKDHGLNYDNFAMQIKTQIIIKQLRSDNVNSTKITDNQLNNFLLKNNDDFDKNLILSAIIVSDKTSNSRKLKDFYNKTHKNKHKNDQNKCELLKKSSIYNYVENKPLNYFSNNAQAIILDLPKNQVSSIYYDQKNKNFNRILLCKKSLDLLSSKEKASAKSNLLNQESNQQLHQILLNLRKRACIKIL